jgi:Putative cyclase
VPPYQLGREALQPVVASVGPAILNAHFIPPEGSGVPFAGPMGKMTCDKVPPSQWMGPAAVIDVRSVLDDAPNGKSPVITPKMVQDWEGKNGALKAGEVVLFMGMARSQLYEMGEKAQKAANAVSSARDKIDGPEDKDQGIERNGKANFVPSNPDGIAFRRTPQEVLRIVYLTDKSGVSSGGFYPKGMNGSLKST